MIYVTIDTNVYLDILLDPNEYDYNLKEKRYREIIENKEEDPYRYREDKLPLTLIPLKSLCENNAIKLIITEVTKLELEKHNSRYMEEIKRGYKQLEEVIKKEKIWNNIAYIKNELQSVLEQNKKMNIENWNYGYEKLMELIQLENNIYLSLNPDIICNLYRKNIAGLLGNNEKEVENVTKNNDYLFVNTIQEYFKNNKKENDYIFLVTKDKKDFRGEKVTKNGLIYYDLKENFKDDKLDIKVLADMKSLYKLIDSYVDISKQIQQKTDEIFKETQQDSEYSEDSCWHNYIAWYDERIKDEILNEFNKKDKSLDEIKELRIDVIRDIKNILSECRELSSWDDRSELKLYNWLEMNEEEDIDILRLSKLLIIRENLKEYKKIHEEEIKKGE